MESKPEEGSITHAEDARAGHHDPIKDDGVVGRDFTVSGTDLPDGYFRSFSFIGSLIAIGASFGCGVAGFSLIAPVLAFVNADIGPDPNLTWVALSYLLTTSVGLLIVGRVTDIFGRRWWFIGGNAVATVGSIVCAVAPNIPALIAGETLIGIGASVQLSYACELARRMFLPYHVDSYTKPSVYSCRE